MKYWKGLIGTNKENEYGTMDDHGYVPNSITIQEYQYDILQIINKSIPIIQKESDIEKLIIFAKKEGWI